jgi:hypothetical protein
MRTLIIGLLGSTAALAGGCVVDTGPSCNGGKCDGTGDFNSQLDGRNDPIARLLRDSGIGNDGVIRADYGVIVQEVAKLQGCSETSWKTYVVSDDLIEGEAFPRLVSTVCSDDPTRASEFFIAASFKDPAEDDVDPRNLEAFAWDATAGVYRFYAGTPEGADSIRVEIEPDRCQECHLTPKDLSRDGMRMTPIMNELTQPWSHWNSQIPMFNPNLNPFPSHDFHVPEQVRTADDFTRYGKDKVGAAADLEQIIRAGHARVAGERVKERRNSAADWRPAMNMLRPLFCEEQIQYATEDFQTGLVNVTALIPGGIRESYRAIRADNWAWDWVNNQDSRIRMRAPQGLPALSMIPIRGNVDVEYENRLLGVRALTPIQILRVRALDWKRPVFSRLRCGLWQDAAARFNQTAPELNLSGRIADHMKVLYDLILTVDGTSLSTGSETTFVALDLAGPDAASALAAAKRDGGLTGTCAEGAGCVVDVEKFGAMLDQYVSFFEDSEADVARRELLRLRDQRLCHVKNNFENAPALPPVSCN